MGVFGYVLAFVAGVIAGIAYYKHQESGSEKQPPPSEPPVPPLKVA